MVGQFLAVCLYVLVLNKMPNLLDVASLHGCAHFCPNCWVDFPSKSKLVIPAALKDYGCWHLPFACACPTGSTGGNDTKPVLPQLLRCSRVSFTPGPLFLLLASHLPVIAWVSMVALDREEWRLSGDGDLSFPTFI